MSGQGHEMTAGDLQAMQLYAQEKGIELYKPKAVAPAATEAQGDEVFAISATNEAVVPQPNHYGSVTIQATGSSPEMVRSLIQDTYGALARGTQNELSHQDVRSAREVERKSTVQRRAQPAETTRISNRRRVLVPALFIVAAAGFGSQIGSLMDEAYGFVSGKSDATYEDTVDGIKRTIIERGGDE